MIFQRLVPPSLCFRQLKEKSKVSDANCFRNFEWGGGVEIACGLFCRKYSAGNCNLITKFFQKWYFSPFFQKNGSSGWGGLV